MGHGKNKKYNIFSALVGSLNIFQEQCIFSAVSLKCSYDCTEILILNLTSRVYLVLNGSPHLCVMRYGAKVPTVTKSSIHFVEGKS